QTLYINEIMASNAAAFMDGDAWDFNDWVEIYNPSAAPVTIGGHYLTNDLDMATMWQITPLTATIPAGGYAIFWADEEDSGNRTNFKLDADGGEIGLFDSGGTLVDAVIFGAQMTDVSYGRETDGSPNLRFFGQSTGKASNNTAEPFVDTSMVAPKPDMSVASGFYTTTQSVTLSNALLGSQIWYTTDGSLPTLSNGTLYNGSPIALNNTTTLRARTFMAGYIPSKTESRTIFINTSSTLPIVSISINPEYLNDSIIGIFVAGSNGAPKSNCESYQPRNYYQPWERPIAVQVFEPDGNKVIDMDAGLRTYGNCSRGASHKSITIRARDRYGDDDLSYQFLDDRDVDQFPVILMRNGGQDYTDTLMRDATAQSIMAGQADFDYQEYEPAVVYINGQYRGILNFRDKIDERFVETYYGYTEDQIEMIDRVRYGPAQPILEPRIGTMDDYNDLMAYVKNNDMTDPIVYDAVTQRIDIDAHMNYYIAQIYNATTDWPSNNVRMWRPLDGKWRWMLFDTESGFRATRINTNNLARATSNGPEWAYIIMQRLMVNQTYREEFAQRYAAHLNITFDPDRVIGIIDEHEAALAPEIPAHQSRWGFPSNWATRVDDLRAFALARPATQFSHVISYNGTDRIAATAPLNIVTYPAGGGEVRVHDVLVPSDDFTGDFFTTIPIRLEATPKPGFRFIGWQQAAQADIANAATTIAINGAHTITAVFEQVSPVVINEIHYHPTDLQGADEEYIELFNTSTTDTIDLTNYSFTNGITYTFPAAVTLPPQSYLLLTHPNSVAYGAAACPVYKWSSGRLSNDGEIVELSNHLAEVADYVAYNDQTPWPIEADGLGPAMALYEATADNTDPANWRASIANNGTPCAPNVVTVLAVDDDFTVEYGSTNNLFSTILDNDQAGFAGDTLSITAVGAPLLGTIDSFTADTIHYNAPASAGSDSFTYTIMNSLGLTSTAQIDITITPPLPGGVDNGLVMWLKADAGTNTTVDGQNVTAWADQAGNHDASNLTAPTYQNGALNFNPLVDFSGGNMGMTINNAADINTSSFTAKTFCIAFTTGTDVVTRQMVYEQGGGTNGVNLYVLNNQLYANLWAS
ncbi:MAG: CotH kinase family protein, partial [Anaerolineales bacterium]|nr:CotH kinase family protein [Anaerolineales bacterium]